MDEDPQHEGIFLHDEILELLIKYGIDDDPLELIREISSFNAGSEFIQIRQKIEKVTEENKLSLTPIALLKSCFDVLKENPSSESLCLTILSLTLIILPKIEGPALSSICHCCLEVLSNIEIGEKSPDLLLVKLIVCCGEVLRVEEQWTGLLILKQVQNIFYFCQCSLPLVRQASWETLRAILSRSSVEHADGHPASGFIVGALLQNILKPNASQDLQILSETLDFIENTHSFYGSSPLRKVIQILFNYIIHEDSRIADHCQRIIMRSLPNSPEDYQWIMNSMEELIANQDSVPLENVVIWFQTVSGLMVHLLEMDQTRSIPKMTEWVLVLSKYLCNEHPAHFNKVASCLKKLFETYKVQERLDIEEENNIMVMISSVESVIIHIAVNYRQQNVGFIDKFFSSLGSQVPSCVGNCLRTICDMIWYKPQAPTNVFKPIILTCIDIIGMGKVFKLFPTVLTKIPETDRRFELVINLLKLQRSNLTVFYEYVWPLIRSCEDIIKDSSDTDSFYENLRVSFWECLPFLCFNASDTQVPFQDPLFVESVLQALHDLKTQQQVLQSLCKLTGYCLLDKISPAFMNLGNTFLKSLITIFLKEEPSSNRDHEVSGRAIENIIMACKEVIDPDVVDEMLSSITEENDDVRHHKLLHILKALVKVAKPAHADLMYGHFCTAIQSPTVAYQKKGYQGLENMLEANLIPDLNKFIEFLEQCPTTTDKAQAPRLRCLTLLLKKAPDFFETQIVRKIAQWAVAEALVSCKAAVPRLVRTACFNVVKQAIVSLQLLCGTSFDLALKETMKNLINIKERHSVEDICNIEIMSAVFYQYKDKIRIEGFRDILLQLLPVINQSTRNFKQSLKFIQFGFYFYPKESVSPLIPEVLKTLENLDAEILDKCRFKIALFLMVLGRKHGWQSFSDFIEPGSKLTVITSIATALFKTKMNLPEKFAQNSVNESLEDALDEMNQLTISNEDIVIPNDLIKKMNNIGVKEHYIKRIPKQKSLSPKDVHNSKRPRKSSKRNRRRNLRNRMLNRSKNGKTNGQNS